MMAEHVPSLAGLRAENARLQARVDNQEPWLAALGRMLVEHRIVHFPGDVLAWREERDGYKARVEEAVASAGQAWQWYNREARTAGELIWADSEREEMQEQRDHYKALAERRGEALWKALPALHHYGRPHEQGNLDCPRCPADAALAATPELTNC